MTIETEHMVCERCMEFTECRISGGEWSCEVCTTLPHLALTPHDLIDKDAVDDTLGVE